MTCKNPLFNQKGRLNKLLGARPNKKELEERNILRSEPVLSESSRRKLETTIGGDRNKERNLLVERNILHDEAEKVAGQQAVPMEEAKRAINAFLVHETELVADGQGVQMSRRARRLEKTNPVHDPKSGVTACKNPLAGSNRLARMIANRPKPAELRERNILQSDREERRQRLQEARAAVQTYLESKEELAAPVQSSTEGHSPSSLAVSKQTPEADAPTTPTNDPAGEETWLYRIVGLVVAILAVLYIVVFDREE